MNILRKDAAVKKFTAAYANGATAEELRTIIAQDEKDYSASEIEEIVSAIINQEPPDNSQVLPGADINGPGDSQLSEAQKTLNKLYEEWQVEPNGEMIKQYKKDERPVDDKCFEKLKKLRITSITPERAELLNQQSENTNLRLYPVEEN